MTHLHLLLLVNDNVKDDLVLVGEVIFLVYLDIGILVAFVVEIFLSKDFSTVDHVRRDLSTFKDTELLLHILTLRLLQTIVVDRRYTRPWLEGDMQIDLIAHDRVG